MSDFSIYLISLKNDVARRINLSSIFGKSYSDFNLFEAIDGRELKSEEYYTYLSSHRKRNNSVMTPGEVGCALSHLAVLEQFINSEKKYALVIEDDVIGNEYDLFYIEKLSQILDDHSILICGGQIHNHLTRRLVYGVKVVDQVYRVAKESMPYISSTCCYVISRYAAQQIINHQKECFTVADDWSSFFSNEKYKFYFANILQHPQDQSLSNIEILRNAKNNKHLIITSFLNLIVIVKNRFRVEIFRLTAMYSKRWKNLL